jgi:hypothetical protein
MGHAGLRIVGTRLFRLHDLGAVQTEVPPRLVKAGPVAVVLADFRAIGREPGSCCGALPVPRPVSDFRDNPFASG